MHHNVLICIGLNLVVNIISNSALGISSKLDLDGLVDSSPKLVGTQHRYKPLSHRQIRIEDAKPSADNLENIGVVCISGKGCNTTQSNQSGDSIETDVIVHVKTTIESNKNNKSKAVEENPDVPIIIGTGDNNLRDEQNVISNSRNLVVTTSNDNFFPVNPIVSPLPTTGSLYGNVYPQKYNFLPNEPRVNLNIEPLPTVSLTRNDDFKYKTGLQIPRFEPSYHRHYFEENPPQQVVWYSKATLKPSAWSPGVIQSTTHRHHAGPGGVCSCKNEVSRGLQWYPTRPLYKADAGSEINDKLAPLA